jgi:hypothetical protein
VVGILAVALAPTFTDMAFAKKSEVTTCPSGNECQGGSGDKNPNRAEECRAGANDQTNANCP